MVTSLMEMLELPNFGHMTTSTIYFESRDKFMLATSQTEFMTSQPLFENTFADTIKNSTHFTKTSFDDSKK